MSTRRRDRLRIRDYSGTPIPRRPEEGYARRTLEGCDCGLRLVMEYPTVLSEPEVQTTARRVLTKFRGKRRLEDLMRREGVGRLL